MLSPARKSPIKTTAKCIPCFLRQTAEALALVGELQADPEMFTRRVILFTVKCPLVAAQIGEPTSILLANKSAHWSECPPDL